MEKKAPNIKKDKLLPYIRKAWKEIKAYLIIQRAERLEKRRLQRKQKKENQ